MEALKLIAVGFAAVVILAVLALWLEGNRVARMSPEVRKLY